MVPRKFNIVDFGGFDLVAQSGETIPGIYDRIMDSHWNCVYIMCFGLKFAGFVIAPQYMTPEITEDTIELGGFISITRDDAVTVHLAPPPTPPTPEPIIIPLSATEDGTYEAPEGVDGYNPVVVNTAQHDPQLPEGFTRLDYIEFTRHAGYLVEIPNTCIIEATATPTIAISSTEACVMGYRVSSSNNADFEIIFKNNSFYGYVRSQSNGCAYDPDNEAGLNKKSKTKLFLIGARSQAYIGRYAVYSSSAYYGFTGYIHEIRMWNPNNAALLALFVPVSRDSDSTFGFYELVSGTFYNDPDLTGGGSVLPGPVLSSGFVST